MAETADTTPGGARYSEMAETAADIEDQKQAMILQSRTAQMADQIRRLPKRPLEHVDPETFDDDWQNHGIGYTPAMNSWMTDAWNMRVYYRHGEFDVESDDPRLKNVWTKHHEMYLMMTEIEKSIDESRYFQKSQHQYETGEVLWGENAWYDSDDSFGEKFQTSIDDTEDALETSFPHSQGTLAHERYMDVKKDFVNKWQDEVFSKDPKPNTQVEGVQWI